jgi:hypothetical protein
MTSPICYLNGNQFKNIFGGTSPSQYGYIIHATDLPKQTLVRWPYLKNKYMIDDGANWNAVANTWKQALKIAKERWPNCVPSIYHEEYRESFPDAQYVKVEE